MNIINEEELEKFAKMFMDISLAYLEKKVNKEVFVSTMKLSIPLLENETFPNE